MFFKIILPMKYFTPKNLKPRESTLNIIRQIAYTYRVANSQVLCIN
jgi:hypothetical protein